MNNQLRVGVCGIGLEAYWSQFDGLRSRLEGYLQEVADRFAARGVVVEALGMVDNAVRGREAGSACRRSDVDLLVIYVTTYALSNTVLPMVQRAKTPVVLLNLQPEAAIDYVRFNELEDRTAMTAEWLAYCSACPVPEIANVMLRAGLPFHQVTGALNDEGTWTEIYEWLEAARVKKTLADTRLGLMGRYYSGMLDIVTDLTQVSIVFGTHIEHLEVDELSGLRADVSESEIKGRIQEFGKHFDLQPDCGDQDLMQAARTSVALDRLVEVHDLQALAYYASGRGVAQNAETMSSIILGTSLLTARHIPVAGEYEVKNVLAMKILDCMGAGGSFSEYYALDLKLDHVLMGHDGPGHLEIAENKTKVRSLERFHGKSGQGLSVEMSVTYGDVTLLSVVEAAGHGFKLLVAEGESVAGEVLRIGNTNSHYRFPIGALGFVNAWNERGPAHHCAIGVGHLSSKLRKVARLLEIPFEQVC
jgi:L-arabinose isomerase